MAYIYFDDLKEILPVILSDWIEPGDEGWEWIFQEIEQKCYLDKKKKDKKKRKTKTVDLPAPIESMVIADQRNDINELQNRNTQLNILIKDIQAEVRRLRNDITAAKSMAETAKRRTEVDYSKYSGKSDGRIKYYAGAIREADIVQDIFNRMAKRGATKEELDTFRGLIHKYNALDAIINNCNPEDKDCKTCKYYCNTEVIKGPCIECDAYQYWEAKEVNRYEDSN